jgi:hypothetical protein
VQWEQRIAAASERLDAAHHTYRLIQLELLQMRQEPDDKLELGLDIAELEAKLRRAAAGDDRAAEHSSEPGAAG